MTTPDDWEQVGRETTYWMLMQLVDDVQVAFDPVASTVFWGYDVSAEEVEQVRSFAFEVVYVTEAYLARLCDTTTPWDTAYVRDPGYRPDPLPTVNEHSDQPAEDAVNEDERDPEEEL